MSLPTQIYFTWGSFNSNGRHYELDAAQSTTDSKFYEWVESNGSLIGGQNYGIEFRKHADGSTWIYANTGGNNNDPATLGINDANYSSSIEITSTNVTNGDYVQGSNNRFRFDINSNMLFSSSGGGTSSESTSTAVASLGTSSGGVLKMFIPASSTGGSYSVFEGSTLKQVTTHAVTVADLVPITSWSMGNSSIWHVYFNGSIINTWPAVIPSTSTIKKVHCNFW